jgi:ubiquinone/menaquinone biosynthesis C-methylase UbiE
MASPTELVALQETLYRSANPTRRWLHCSRRDWIIAALRRHASPGGQALEVGPGCGVYLPVLASLFGRVVAADIEEAYLRHAARLRQTLPNLELVRDDVCASSLPAQSFDLVLCTEVIEHIPQSEAVLRGIRRLLKPGGVLVLSTPQRYSPLELAAKVAFLPGVIQLVRQVYREPVLETGHINLMTAHALRRQLHGAGFGIVEQHRSGLYLPLVAEFGGEPGLRFLQWLAGRLGVASSLLWTQYYVARSAAS